jgi:hypothetical protein
MISTASTANFNCGLLSDENRQSTRETPKRKKRFMGFRRVAG